MIERWSTVVPYFGLGMGAFSTAANYWVQNNESLSGWMERVRGGQLPLASGSLFDDKERFMVTLMRYIRVFSRVKRDYLLTQSGSTRFAVERLIHTWLEMGLAMHEDEWLVFTEAGCSLIHWLIDDLAHAFVDGAVNTEIKIAALNI